MFGALTDNASQSSFALKSRLSEKMAKTVKTCWDVGGSSHILGNCHAPLLISGLPRPLIDLGQLLDCWGNPLNLIESESQYHRSHTGGPLMTVKFESMENRELPEQDSSICMDPHPNKIRALKPRDQIP